MMSDIPQARSRRGPPGESGAVILRRCIETEAENLRGTLAVYLHRAWAMSHEEARERAHDVLAEVVTIALKKAADFDPRRNPYAWLLPSERAWFYSTATRFSRSASGRPALTQRPRETPTATTSSSRD